MQDLSFITIMLYKKRMLVLPSAYVLFLRLESAEITSICEAASIGFSASALNL